VRVGVIGVGRMGLVHAGTLTDLPTASSVLVWDVDDELAHRVGSELNVEVAASLEELFGGVDAVVIAAASSAHAELLHAAADAGLPAFCEKPISLDVASTVEVVEHVRRASIPVQMGFQRRFDAGYLAAHELVRTSALGTLYVVRMAGHDPEPPHEAYIPVSGGIFRDFSVHDFDALRFVTGQEVVEVYADGAVVGFPVFSRYDDVDTAVVTLKLSDGPLGILSVTRDDAYGYDVRMELIGSADCVAVGWDGRIPLRSVEQGGPAAVHDPYPNFQDRFRPAYRAEMAAFLEVASGTRESPCTPEDALEALRVAVACDTSRREHRPVRLEEVA
jgi:myo-inositol 2-dehydrogenase / D-chiro-inositol 1-dehydrogenase